MQKKAEMSYTKLSLMLISLSIIWVMCSQAESQLPERFEQQLANKLGGTNIDKKKLQIAMQIKSSISKQNQTKAKTQMNRLFQQQYNISSSTEQTICVIVRSFAQQSQGDQDYLTLKSIISQQYKNYHIIYLSEKNSQSISKYKSYLTSNQIHDDKYIFVEGKADVIASLLLAVNKCSANGIVHIMENGQYLITNQVFKLINSIFKPEKQIDLIWSNSLYKNDKIGFSVAYPQNTKTKKNFRQYQFAANEVNIFRNSLLIQNKKQFSQHALVNPLWLAQSYMLTLMQRSKNFQYIPEILTFKNKNRKFISQRTELQINISELIFKNQSIIPLIEKQSKQLNSH